MIKVYFQSIAGLRNELVAVFESETIYGSVEDALSTRAAVERCIVTKVVEDMSPVISHLRDAIDETQLSLDAVDETESVEAYTKQINDLKSIENLLEQLN